MGHMPQTREWTNKPINFCQVVRKTIKRILKGFNNQNRHPLKRPRTLSVSDLFDSPSIQTNYHNLASITVSNHTDIIRQGVRFK